MSKKENDLNKIKNKKFEELIHQILTSPGEYIEKDDLKKLYALLRKAKFITPACGAGIMRMSDTTGGLSIPAFTSMDEYNLEFTADHIWPIIIDFASIMLLLEDETLDGLAINPHTECFYFSRDMLMDAFLID